MGCGMSDDIYLCLGLERRDVSKDVDGGMYWA